MKLKRRYTIYTAVIMLVVNVLNQYGDTFPVGVQTYIPIGSTVLVGVVGILAHNFNPDGTPAVRPHLPPRRKDGGYVAPRNLP